MGNALLLDGMGQRLRDVLLPHHVLKALRPILASYYLVTHVNAEFGVPSAERDARPTLSFRIPHSAFKIQVPG